MENLFKLYDIATPKECGGCSILGKSKSQHCIPEPDLKLGEILFISDSFKLINGSPSPFRLEEYELFVLTLNKMFGSKETKILLDRAQFTASVKCPGVREDDMSKDDRGLCRFHLFNSIDKVKPKLIFACGNLPLVMLTKKSGVGSKRGKEFPIKLESGHECIVVPIFHPWQVIAEPKNSYLFELDIKNAIDKIIFDNIKKSDFKFELIDSIDKIRKYSFLTTTKWNISVDLETTGLDFRRDKINTVAISWKNDEGEYQNICFPIYHKDNPVPDIVWLFIKFISEVLANPRNKKIFHNGKFDMRYLTLVGVEKIVNPWDTKFLMHLYDENLPKSLKDCVGYFFSSEMGKIQESTEESNVNS